MCTMVDLEMFSTMDFLMIRVYKGYGINSAWLPKRQPWVTFLICINARWPRIDIGVFDTRTVCSNIKCSTSFKDSFVHRIQFQCYFLMSRSMSCAEGQGMPSLRRPGAVSG